MKKLLFIINPKAGQKKNKGYIYDAYDAFRRGRYQVIIKYTRKRGDGTRLVEKYGNRSDLIVCMGGDGTLNEVMHGMARAKIKTPLGYIPAGSTNDFAKSIGLSSDIRTAANFIVEHEARPIDLGWFNGRYYVYTAATGTFSSTSYETSQKLKNRLGHFAYVISAIKELFKIRKINMEIEADGKVIDGSYIFASINSTKQMGGVMKFDSEDVKFNDGLFEMMLIEYPSKFYEPISIIWKVLRQKFNGKIKFTKVKEVRIFAPSAPNWTLDGEKQQGSTVIHFKVIPSAVNMIY